jgi:hypothetical protein
MSNVGHKSAKERISERIKASAISRRLQEFALAEPLDDDYLNKQMTQPQVTAARILLSKVVPDLKQTEHTGDLTVRVNKVERTIVDPEPTDS